MTSKLDRWLKWLWLVIGIFMLMGALAIVYDVWFKDLFRKSRYPRQSGPIVGQELEESQQEGVALQEVRLGLPVPIFNSDYRAIPIYELDLRKPKRVTVSESVMGLETVDLPLTGYRGYPSHMSGKLNILFFKWFFEDAHLLLDRRGYIARMDYPGPEDSLQTFIAYELMFEDTNGDGRINDADRGDLYLSDLDGRNLRRITSEKIDVTGKKWDVRFAKLYMTALEVPDDPKVPREHWEEHLYVYELATGKLERQENVAEMLGEAKRILRR